MPRSSRRTQKPPAPVSTSCHSNSSSDDDDFFDSIEPPNCDTDNDEVNKDGKCSTKVVESSRELKSLMHERARARWQVEVLKRRLEEANKSLQADPLVRAEEIKKLRRVVRDKVSVSARVCTVLAFSGFWAFRSFPKIIRVSVWAFGPFSSEGLRDLSKSLRMCEIYSLALQIELVAIHMRHDEEQLELRNPFQYLKCKFHLKCRKARKYPTFNILPLSEQEGA